METINEYGNGRQSVINELKHYIESELGKLAFERRQIPYDTKDLQLSHKRATLAGNVIALNRVLNLLKKKERNLKSNPNEPSKLEKWIKKKAQ